MIALVGLLLNTGVMALLLEFTNLHYVLAQLLTVLVVMVWNFLGNRRWTFGETTGAPAA